MVQDRMNTAEPGLGKTNYDRAVGQLETMWLNNSPLPAQKVVGETLQEEVIGVE